MLFDVVCMELVVVVDGTSYPNVDGSYGRKGGVCRHLTPVPVNRTSESTVTLESSQVARRSRRPAPTSRRSDRGCEGSR